MGARQSRRSVDITTTPKKEVEGVVGDAAAPGDGKLEKIEEADAKPTTNGTALHTDATPEDKDKDKDEATEKEKEKEDAPKVEEPKVESPTSETPAEGAAEVTTPTEGTPASPTSATSPESKETKKKDKSKKKWSFRSISFGKKDKNKPVREDAPKNGDVAKETLAEGGEAAEASDLTEVPEVPEASPTEKATTEQSEAVAEAPAAAVEAKAEEEKTPSPVVAPVAEVAVAAAVAASPVEEKKEEPSIPAPTPVPVEAKKTEEIEKEVEPAIAEKIVEVSPVQAVIEAPVEVNSQSKQIATTTTTTTTTAPSIIERKTSEDFPSQFPSSPPPTPIDPSPLQQAQQVAANASAIAEALKLPAEAANKANIANTIAASGQPASTTLSPSPTSSWPVDTSFTQATTEQPPKIPTSESPEQTGNAIPIPVTTTTTIDAVQDIIEKTTEPQKSDVQVTEVVSPSDDQPEDTVASDVTEIETKVHDVEKEVEIVTKENEVEKEEKIVTKENEVEKEEKIVTKENEVEKEEKIVTKENEVEKEEKIVTKENDAEKQIEIVEENNAKNEVVIVEENNAKNEVEIVKENDASENLDSQITENEDSHSDFNKLQAGLAECIKTSELHPSENDLVIQTEEGPMPVSGDFVIEAKPAIVIPDSPVEEIKSVEVIMKAEKNCSEESLPEPAESSEELIAEPTEKTEVPQIIELPVAETNDEENSDKDVPPPLPASPVPVPKSTSQLLNFMSTQIEDSPIIDEIIKSTNVTLLAEEISCPLPPPVADIIEPTKETESEVPELQTEEQTDTSCSLPPPEEIPEPLIEPVDDKDLPPAPQQIEDEISCQSLENVDNEDNSKKIEMPVSPALSIPEIPTDTTLLTPPTSPSPSAATTKLDIPTRESSRLELLDDSSNREFKTESVEDSLNSYNDSELELKERLAETMEEDNAPVSCQLSNAVQEKNDQSKIEAPVENNVVATENGTTENKDDAPKSPPPAVPAETLAPALGPAITEDVASVTKAIEEIDINEKAVAAAVNENIESANTNEIIADMNHQNNMIE